MKVVYNNVLPFWGFKAMTIGPWIFCRQGTELTSVDINHEAIHWEQYKELLIVVFPFVYIILFSIELVACAINHDRGKIKNNRKNNVFKRTYRSIALEREAYEHENDMEYVARRPLWNWMKI